MTILFVSDLHLHESRPESSLCFLDFLQQETRDIDALYILGDLFESWIGDDAPHPYLSTIIAGLCQATESGLACYFAHGNRDFLIGERFCAESGVQLMTGPTVISIYGQQVLLMHGDELCTDDKKYQKLRRTVHNPTIQSLFLKLPPKLRQSIWNRARNRSQISAMQKAESIMDVNQQTVRQFMKQHDVKMLIHGHTHRPHVHEFDIDGKPAMRIVLGDWYEQGSVLEWTASGPTLKVLEFQKEN